MFSNPKMVIPLICTRNEKDPNDKTNAISDKLISSGLSQIHLFKKCQAKMLLHHLFLSVINIYRLAVNNS